MILMCVLDHFRKLLFVNTFTNESQWTRPTKPAYPEVEPPDVLTLEAAKDSNVAGGGAPNIAERYLSVIFEE